MARPISHGAIASKAARSGTTKGAETGMNVAIVALPAARYWTTSVIVAMPIGSRPEKGSSRTSSSGSSARATASWIR